MLVKMSAYFPHVEEAIQTLVGPVSKASTMSCWMKIYKIQGNPGQLLDALVGLTNISFLRAVHVVLEKEDAEVAQAASVSPYALTLHMKRAMQPVKTSAGDLAKEFTLVEQSRVKRDVGGAKYAYEDVFKYRIKGTPETLLNGFVQLSNRQSQFISSVALGLVA